MTEKILLILLFSIITVAQCRASEEEPDVALWLARSCIGEVGWAANETTECYAIWHIYKKHAERAQRPLYEVMREYSGALKKRRTHPNKWVFFIERDADKPVKHWPSKRCKWRPLHRRAVLQVVDMAEAFLRGEIPDPLPDATHFGSAIDPKHPNHRRIETPGDYRNRFYR